MVFPPGKLPAKVLEKLLKKIHPLPDSNRVHIGPKMGQDTAVLDFGEKYLILKSDPITFITDEIGYYVVSININDIVLSGAIPKWFMSTILLPENSTTEDFVETIFEDIAHECKKWEIAVIGGHTEVTTGLKRPIVIGTMIGEVAKQNLITTMGGKPGDDLLLTQGILIEGSAIIATEKADELKANGFSEKLINLGKSRLHNPGICIMKEARLLAENFNIHAMHDPTEGGLAMGIVEMAENSDCGVIIDYNSIPFLEPTLDFCNFYNLDPLRTIASGCIVCAVSPKDTDRIIEFMRKFEITVAKIGILNDKIHEYKIKNQNGQIEDLKYSPIDEITKIF